jgi:hypothetical protein
MRPSLLALVVLGALGSCDTAEGPPVGPGTQGAGYQQACNPQMGALACQQGYFSQSRGTQVNLECFPHQNGVPLCTYRCTPRSTTECDLPSTGCNGMGVCRDPGPHGQNQ